MSIPGGLHREVDTLLREYLVRKHANRGCLSSVPFSRSSSSDSFATDEGLFDRPDPQTSTSVVMEKILRRRSLQLRNQQQAWQVCLVLGNIIFDRLTAVYFYLPSYIVIMIDLKILSMKPIM